MKKEEKHTGIGIVATRCNGCGLYSDICPNEVIVMEEKNKKRKAVTAWTTLCTECGRCIMVCGNRAIGLFVTASEPQVQPVY